MARMGWLLLVMAATGCIRNPATGTRQLMLLSMEEEIELGQQAKAQVEQTTPLYGDQRLGQYVAKVGNRLAAASERPGLPWSFQVVDDPSVNAFALPGGPIFITRGLLAHMNSEAELASVLGHEIGHVTARHAAAQLSRAQLAQLGLGVGTLFVPELGQFGAVTGLGLQLLLLQYSRSAEREADALGFRYLLEQAYDVREMKDLFVTLQRATPAAGARLPEWLSTHPDPGNRLEATEERIAQAQPLNWSQLTVDRERYLQSIDGLVYGADSQQGFFQGQTFLHPQLGFALQFPDQWKTQNRAQRVGAVSPAEDAAVQLSPAGKYTPQQALEAFYGKKGIAPLAQTPGVLSRLPHVSGYFTARGERGTLAGLVMFVQHGGRTYQLTGYTPAERLSSYDSLFRQTLESFAPFDPAEAPAPQTMRLEVTGVPQPMSLASFQQQFPSAVSLEELAVLNGLSTEAELTAGQKLKRVVRAPAP